MTRFRFASISLVVTVLAVCATSFALAHGGDLEKIHSCLDKKGNLRVIAAQAVCEKDETPLDWNIEGLAGTAGPTGATGTAGAKGDKGDTGASAAASFPGERAIGFARISGVLGDSQVAGHLNEVVITGFKTSETATIIRSGGAGGGSIGRANFTNFTITKTIDKASPQLVEKLAAGRNLPEIRVDITMPDASGQPVTFRYTLEDVFLTSVTTSSDGHNGESPLEVVTFDFNKITIEHHAGTTTTDTCFDLDRFRAC